MVKEFLKIAGVRSEEQFYKKYPSEEAFFRAHPEARKLLHQRMAYGGMYAYQTGGEPVSSDYPDSQSFLAAKEAWQASQGIPQVDQNAYELPAAGANGLPDYLRAQEAPAAAVVATPAAAAQQRVTLKDYKGPSVYDMLEAQGKAGDLQSRKGLAKTLGIANYKGTPTQNAQMMEMIRQNPDVLLNYTGAPAPMAPAPKKNVSSTAKPKTTTKAAPVTTKKEVAAADNSGSLLGGFKSQYDFGTPTANQSSVGTSKTAISKSTPGYGKKGDAYADGLIDRSVKNKAMTDYSTQQYFNEEVGKTLAKLAPSAVGLGYLRTAYNFFQPRYEAYNPNQLPPSGGRVAGQKALPAKQQRALPASSQMKQLPPSQPRGWTMKEGTYRSPNYPFHKYGGAYGNVPQHGNPGTYADGTSGTSNGGQSFAFGGDLLKGFSEGMRDGSLQGLAANVLGMSGGMTNVKNLNDKSSNLKSDLTNYLSGAGSNIDAKAIQDIVSKYQAGGSYNPTSVDYGDMLPQFAMGYDVPTAMYGMGMAYGGTPCYNCGGMYEDGGSPLYSTQGQALRNFMDTVAYGSGGNQSMHNIQFPAVGPRYQEGGMPPEQAAMMAQQQGQQQAPPQQGGGMDPQQLMQEVAQMLQQGAQPEQIMQQLVQEGVPEQMAQQIIQQVMQQMQGAQQQAPPPQQGGMKMGGTYKVGSEYDMSPNDIQKLIAQGYKIQYI